MVTDFSALKKTRKNSLDTITRELDKLNTAASGGADTREWKPTVDKAGNGYAVFRFLPAPMGEEVPFVRVFNHGFQGPGGWYIENSLTTLGNDDPVSEVNSKLWNSGIEANKEIARKQKRRLNFWANIYMINDHGNPDNNGKVFLYKFGKKIFEKINEAMHPQFEDEAAINPFDLWEGANFKLKIRNFEGYRNYDKSEFDNPGPLFDNDEKLEAVWKECHSIAEKIAPKEFKSYDELKKKLEKVLGIRLDSAEGPAPRMIEEAPARSSREAAPKQSPEKESDLPWDDSDDEDVSYFKNLVKG
jgi:hypothetical protein